MRPYIGILRHVLERRQICFLGRVGRSQPFVEGGPHLRHRDPHAGVVSPHPPVPLRRPAHPTRHRRVQRQDLRQRLPHRVQYERPERILAVVEHHGAAVRPHRVIRRRQRVHPTRPARIARHRRQLRDRRHAARHCRRREWKRQI